MSYEPWHIQPDPSFTGRFTRPSAPSEDSPKPPPAGAPQGYERFLGRRTTDDPDKSAPVEEPEKPAAIEELERVREDAERPIKLKFEREPGEESFRRASIRRQVDREVRESRWDSMADIGAA
jgi:hypothetical protein